MSNNQYILSADKSYSMQQLVEYIVSRNSSSGALLLAIFLKPDLRMIGTIKLEPIDYSSHIAWLGMLIGDLPSRGQGYGFEALTAVLGHAFNEMQLRRVFLGVDKMNYPAINLYSKIGFHVTEEKDSSFTMAIDPKGLKLE